MQTNYYIDEEEVKVKTETAAERLLRIGHLIAPLDSHPVTTSKDLGRNLWTRMVDTVFAAVRRYTPPLHWFLATLTAVMLFVYVRLLALTVRVVAPGKPQWPDLPAPSVIALWHGDAPSLLVAFASQRPALRSVILVAGDARGDAISQLCRWLGFTVIRGGGPTGGWNILIDLAQELAAGAYVFVTTDGGGPAHVAKVGAVALAAAARVPLVPLRADCSPALEERHKWDSARNPLPFSVVTVLLGTARRFELFTDPSSVEEARLWLEKTLNALRIGK